MRTAGKLLVLSVLVFGGALLQAQDFYNPILQGAGAPVGACPARRLYINLTDGALWVCQSGTWLLPPPFGSITLAQLPFGAANQILGTNAAAAAIEHKTLGVGTTGSDFNIANAANSIVFHLPDATGAVRGALTAANWTTFNGKENVLTFNAPLSRAVNTVSIPVATALANGYLASGDWTTFNNKQATISVTTPITLGGGTSVGMVNVGTTTTVLHGNAAGNAAFSGVSLTADATVNQGTTTTLLHGNAAGAPSWGGVSLANDTAANQGTTTTVLHGNAAGQPSFAAILSADLNITGTTCTNQFVSAISSAAAGTCTTATLASAQFANQGTTTTVAHGNAAGNPSWSAVTSADTTGTFPATAHNLLSATHGDATAASPTRGDLVTAQVAAPNTKWQVYAKGTQYQVLTGGANEVTWGAVDLTQATAVAGILGSVNGGTANGFTKFSGATTGEKTYSLPDASTTILTTNAAVTAAQGGTGAAPTNDDYIPVADSAVAITWRAMPDCTDALGRHINYTVATNSFSCGTSGAAGAWNSITAAAGALTLANTSFASTFTQTSAVNWSWNNITPATNVLAQSSPIFNLGGRTWHAAADTADNWAIQNIVANGTDGASTLTLTHTGSTGAAAVSAPGFVSTGTGAGFADFVEGAAQTATAESVGFQAPVDVTSAYHITLPAAPAVGLVHRTNATPSVESVSLLAVGDVGAIFKTRAITFLLGADNGAVLVDADDQATIFRNTLGQGITITEVWCECDGGTPRIQLQRDDGSPANILTDNAGAGMDCSTAGATGTLDGTEEHIASTNKIDFVMVTAGGTAKRITLAITYTLD